MTRTWLIGENNPYGGDPRHDLFCFPKNSSGERLQRLILAVERRVYLDSERYVRRNLLRGRSGWSKKDARAAAEKLVKDIGSDPVVLLGMKVTEAFGHKYRPFAVIHVDGLTAACVPHPSGLNRLWNEEGAFAKARQTIADAEHIAEMARAA